MVDAESHAGHGKPGQRARACVSGRRRKVATDRGAVQLLGASTLRQKAWSGSCAVSMSTMARVTARGATTVLGAKSHKSKTNLSWLTG